MIFFFIVPVWLIFVCASSLLFLFKRTRWLGGYLVTASTLSVVFSFLASLLGLVGFAAAGDFAGAGDYKGVLAIGGYGLGLILGGLFGGVAGLALVGGLHYLAWKKARKEIVQP